jgi:hypothetical protein
MAIPISGTTGRVIALPDTSASISTQVTGQDSRLTLDASALVLSPVFRVEDLGTRRQILAGVERLGRAVIAYETETFTYLGETDRNVVGQVSAFIECRAMPREVINEEFFSRIDQRDAADTEQTRESRARSVLDAGLEMLKQAEGPGLNLLNVIARTGLIVALTTVLRQVVSYYVEQAIQEGDSPQASQAWAVAAITMIGPAMSLMGAIRDECAGTANLQTRLGRVCMASITMGSWITAHLTGASSSMLTSAIATNVYTTARDVINAFVPLQSNAGDATTSATAVTTVFYGLVQHALAVLGAPMPLSGAGRYAAGLGYSLGADFIQGVLNAAGAVIDDFIFILCRSWPLLSPTAGLDSALSDPESLQRSVLEVRAGARLPSRAQLADALLNVNASRTSAFQAINLAVGAAAVELALSDYGETTQGHILNICLMGMLMLIYFPFIWTCSQRSDRSWSPEQLREQPTP